jgi:hypothetical protein
MPSSRLLLRHALFLEERSARAFLQPEAQQYEYEPLLLACGSDSLVRRPDQTSHKEQARRRFATMLVDELLVRSHPHPSLATTNLFGQTSPRGRKRARMVSDVGWSRAARNQDKGERWGKWLRPKRAMKAFLALSINQV